MSIAARCVQASRSSFESYAAERSPPLIPPHPLPPLPRRKRWGKQAGQEQGEGTTRPSTPDESPINRD